MTDLLVEDIFGEPVSGNPVAEHSAQLGKGFEEGHPVTHGGQMIGAGKAGRSGPDDGHLFLFLFRRGREAFPGLEGLIPDEALQGVDGRGFIILAAVAGSLAGVETNPPADPGEGVFQDDFFPGSDVVLLPGQDHGRLHVFAGRTGFVAGGQLVQVGRGQVTPGPGLGGQSPLEGKGHGGKRWF